MPKVQPTLTIEVDGQELKVSDLPENIQQLVALYDDWRQKLADAESYAKLVGVSFQVLADQLRNTIVEELTPKTEGDAQQPSEAAA
jgi:hypothetical protein